MHTLDNALLTVLARVKGSDNWTATPQLIARLRGSGHEVKYPKQVLRRLQALEDEGMAVSRQAGRAREWQYRPGAGGFSKGFMPLEEAMALQLLKRFSTHRIPWHAKEHLQALFTVAEDRLGKAVRNDEKRYASWDSKVAAGGNFQLHPPSIDQKVFKHVIDALFRENVLTIRYPSSKHGGPADLHVIPLGLVDQNGLLYLIARPRFSGDFKSNPTQYRLDRIKRAEPLAEEFSYPRNFRLDHYIHQEKKMEFFADEKVAVTLRVSEHLKNRLEETPLHAAQKFTRHRDGTATLEAEVFDSLGFRQWLLGQGRHVKVLKPARLRQYLCDEIEQMHQLYQPASAR